MTKAFKRNVSKRQDDRKCFYLVGIHTVYRTRVHWIQETIQGEHWSSFPWLYIRN